MIFIIKCEVILDYYIAFCCKKSNNSILEKDITNLQEPKFVISSDIMWNILKQDIIYILIRVAKKKIIFKQKKFNY